MRGRVDRVAVLSVEDKEAAVGEAAAAVVRAIAAGSAAEIPMRSSSEIVTWFVACWAIAGVSAPATKASSTVTVTGSVRWDESCAGTEPSKGAIESGIVDGPNDGS